MTTSATHDHQQLLDKHADPQELHDILAIAGEEGREYCDDFPTPTLRRSGR